MGSKAANAKYRASHRGQLRDYQENSVFRSPEYLSWAAMRSRCQNPKDKTYHLYGGAGVTVCQRWSKFTAFLADMGPRPEGTTLDRWPNKFGNYEHGNCKWATYREQAANTKKNLLVTVRGRTLNLADWSRLVGVSYQTLHWRLKHGKLIDDLIPSETQ